MGKGICLFLRGGRVCEGGVGGGRGSGRKKRKWAARLGGQVYGIGKSLESRTVYFAVRIGNDCRTIISWSSGRKGPSNMLRKRLRNNPSPACFKKQFSSSVLTFPLSISISLLAPLASNPHTRRQIIIRTSVNAELEPVKLDARSLCMAVGSEIWVWVLESGGQSIVGDGDSFWCWQGGMIHGGDDANTFECWGGLGSRVE